MIWNYPYLYLVGMMIWVCCVKALFHFFHRFWIPERICPGRIAWRWEYVLNGYSGVWRWSCNHINEQLLGRKCQGVLCKYIWSIWGGFFLLCGYPSVRSVRTCIKSRVCLHYRLIVLMLKRAFCTFWNLGIVVCCRCEIYTMRADRFLKVWSFGVSQ